MSGLVDEYCCGCIYLTRIDPSIAEIMACDYIEATNKRRPCPAGKGCTVKKTGKKYDRRRGEE